MFTFFIQISPSLSLTLPGNLLAGANAEKQRKRKWNPAHAYRGKNSKTKPKPDLVPILQGGSAEQPYLFLPVILLLLLPTIVSLLSLRTQPGCVDAGWQETALVCSVNIILLISLFSSPDDKKVI